MTTDPSSCQSNIVNAEIPKNPVKKHHKKKRKKKKRKAQSSGYKILKILQTSHQNDIHLFPKKGDRVCITFKSFYKNQTDPHYILLEDQSNISLNSNFSIKNNNSPTNSTSNNVISNTLKSFVIGYNQIFFGWEECIPKLSLGQKAQIIMSCDYCYGYEFLDQVPENCYLMFEIHLIQINERKYEIVRYDFGSNGVNISVIGDTETYSDCDSKLIIEKGDYISIHYNGYFHGGSQHGKQFDSSYDQEKVFRFMIGNGKVIRGWDEGLLGLRKGCKVILEITAEYGYGSKGCKPDIKSEQDLKFEIEIIDIDRRRKLRRKRK